MMFVESGVLENETIVDLLPHESPFVMVDQILRYKTNEWIKGIKYIDQNASNVFTNYHIMLCESLAQISKVLDILSNGDEDINISYLTSINMSIQDEVRRGDLVNLFVKWASEFRGMHCFEGVATVADKIVLSGTLYRKIE